MITVYGYNIVKFCNQILNQFREEALKRKIFLQFSSNEPTFLIWVDVEKVEKKGRVISKKGMQKLDIQKETIQTFSIKNGMPNNFINGLLSEGDTALWMSTDVGISRMSIANESFINFYKFDTKIRHFRNIYLHGFSVRLLGFNYF